MTAVGVLRAASGPTEPLWLELAGDVLQGLGRKPPSLPSRWLYDARGSQLFEEITRQPEYYLTRCEMEILEARAQTVLDVSRATSLVELGPGSGKKTRLLLDAATVGGRDVLFAPVDVSVETLLATGRAIDRDYPTVTVAPYAVDFERALPASMPGRPGRRLVAFLGSTIGNFEDDQRSAFLDRLHAACAGGDHLLLGTDLVKSAARLLAAYDDRRGVTATFNRNVIEVLRRELDGTDLHPRDFDHVARWNAARSRIEMWLRASVEVRARFRSIDFEWRLSPGDELRTEISVKFDGEALHRELRGHGLVVRRCWTDPAGDFALTLARFE